MSKFIIEGAKPLKGEMRVMGSKNAALPLIASSVLVGKARFKNIPKIKDVELMLEIISYLGGSYEWSQKNVLDINTESLTSKPLPDVARKLRASVLFVGPLLARFGEAEIPYPGGDFIGPRPLDTHIRAFKFLGVKTEEGDKLLFKKDKRDAGRVVFDEPSVTATENIIMLASGAPYDTEVRLAASEPHVQDLCNFLVASGVHIEGIGTTTLKIKGVSSFNNVEYSVIPDELEVSAFAALAAATNGSFTIKPIKEDFLDSVIVQFEKMGVNFSLQGDSLFINPAASPYRSTTLQSGLYPKLASDHLPPLAVLATQAKGATMVHDWLYDGRQSYIRELTKMGANIKIMDPHRALILGPTPLYGKEVASYDIRSGMAMIIAALIAKGRTVISDIGHIDRGYEDLEGRLRGVGANIKRVE